jgi:hypothetical protein
MMVRVISLSPVAVAVTFCGAPGATGPDGAGVEVAVGAGMKPPPPPPPPPDGGWVGAATTVAVGWVVAVGETVAVAVGWVVAVGATVAVADGAAVAVDVGGTLVAVAVDVAVAVGCGLPAFWTLMFPPIAC